MTITMRMSVLTIIRVRIRMMMTFTSCMIDGKRHDDLHIMVGMLRMMMVTFMLISSVITMHPHHQQSS